GLSSVEHGPDRIFVNKLLAPRRWDLITYRASKDPSDVFVKRLVGLPGEQVVIKDGAVWINGVKQTPPPEIARLTFTEAPRGWSGELWGSPRRPMQLGDDEYFVLG